MNPLSKRIDRLEASNHGTCRFIALQTGSGNTDADLATMLTANGIAPRKTDTIVQFKTVYLDRDGLAIPATRPPAVLSITPSPTQ
jgi:hypothetical protein